MLTLSKIPLLLLSLVVVSHAFRFQGQEDSLEETGTKDPIVPEEFEKDESQREAKKIDPLVVDIERTPIESEVESKSTKTETEAEAEGRFFLKDKLCALGLADVSRQKSFYPNFM